MVVWGGGGETYSLHTLRGPVLRPAAVLRLRRREIMIAPRGVREKSPTAWRTSERWGEDFEDEETVEAHRMREGSIVRRGREGS